MYRYRDGASEVTVDYGQYTSGIALERNPRFRNWRKWTERIGGRRARLVTYQDGGRYHAVALWENLRPHRHLFMDARSSDSRLPLEIVRTVKFAR
jgi:hypothetical protein